VRELDAFAGPVPSGSVGVPDKYGRCDRLLRSEVEESSFSDVFERYVPE